MLTHVTAISSLLLGAALFLIGNGLLNTLLQLRGLNEGYSAAIIGAFMSAYYGGYLIGSWLGKSVIKRIGHIRAFALFASIAAITALVHILIVNFAIWIVLRCLYGMSLICIYIIIESWLNAQVPNALRGRIFAVYMATNFLSLAFSQQLLRLDKTLGFTVFAVAAIAMCASLIPIMLTRRIQPTLPKKQKNNLLTLLKQAPLPLVASALSGMNAGAFWGMAPTYASLKGFTPDDVATLMTAAILGGAAMQYPIGRFSDRFDRRRVLFVVVCAACACSALIALIPDGKPSWLTALFTLWGGLSFTLYPLAVAQLIDQLPQEETLAGSASLLLINGIGATITPVAAGSLIGFFGPDALPVYFMCITAVLAIYTFYRIRFSHIRPVEPFAQFVPMVNTSTTALDMMPEPLNSQDAAAASLAAVNLASQRATDSNTASENNSNARSNTAQEDLRSDMDESKAPNPDEAKTNAATAILSDNVPPLANAAEEARETPDK